MEIGFKPPALTTDILMILLITYLLLLTILDSRLSGTDISLLITPTSTCESSGRKPCMHGMPIMTNTTSKHSIKQHYNVILNLLIIQINTWFYFIYFYEFE